MLLGAITPDAGSMPDRLKVREALGVFAGWYGRGCGVPPIAGSTSPSGR